MAAIIAGLAIAAVGAGVGAYGASQAGKGSGQSRSVDELNSLPYEEQLKQAKAYAEQDLEMQRRAAQQALELYPAQARAQRLEAQRALNQLYPKFVAQEGRQTGIQRGNDLADLQRLGPGYASALGGASSAYGAIGQAVQGGPGNQLLDYLNQQATGQGPLYEELQRQALSELQMGGQLSPEEERAVAQQTRGLYGARGLNYSNPALGAEYLNRNAFARQRQNERRQFGIQTDQLGLQHGQFGLGVQGANEANAGNWRNFLISGSQAQLNPLLQYGMQRSSIRPENIAGFGAGQTSGQTMAPIYASAPTVGSAAQAMAPLYGYTRDVYDTNFNAAESRAQNQAAGYAAIGSGLMSSGSSMAMGGMRKQGYI